MPLPIAGEMDLSALGNAVKEQMSGLDLSMTSLKREPGDFDDDEDVESNVGSEDSNMSAGSIHGEVKVEPKEAPITAQARSSRRKPAAPQWVNPEWQDEKEKQPTGDEVIINGVCVMQTEDYGRRSAEETVRVEPTPVMDHHRFEDDQSDAASSVSNDETQQKEEKEEEEAATATATESANEESENKKQENEEERWDY